MPTYAVSWEERGQPLSTGRLELAESSLLLNGGNVLGRALRELSYGEMTGLRFGRKPADRLGGRPALVLELRDGTCLRIWSIIQPGILSELAERLSAAVPAAA